MCSRTRTPRLLENKQAGGKEQAAWNISSTSPPRGGRSINARHRNHQQSMRYPTWPPSPSSGSEAWQHRPWRPSCKHPSAWQGCPRQSSRLPLFNRAENSTASSSHQLSPQLCPGMRTTRFAQCQLYANPRIAIAPACPDTCAFEARSLKLEARLREADPSHEPLRRTLFKTCFSGAGKKST